MLKRSGKSIS